MYSTLNAEDTCVTFETFKKFETFFRVQQEGKEECLVNDEEKENERESVWLLI